MKFSKSWFAPPSEPYYDWIGEEDERRDTADNFKLALERRLTTRDWVAGVLDPGDMADPGLPPPSTTTPANPYLGLEDVEELMYQHNDPAPFQVCVNQTHYSGLIRYPLALYRRFEAETDYVMEAHHYADDHDGKTLTRSQAKEIVYRQWEHVFSSRMPEITAPIPTWKGEAHRKDIRYDGEWTWELLFMRRFLEYLKLIGDPMDHPSRAIRMPKALTETQASHTLTNYIKAQAQYFETMLGERNSWLPFLLTRPFVVFSVLYDNIQGLGGPYYSRALLCKEWRDNGWWAGGHSYGFLDFDGPGWIWPDESPIYIPEDLPPTLMTSWNLWLGNPEGPQQRLDSPPPRSVSEEELKDDPDLRKRKTCLEQASEYRIRERMRLAEMTRKARAVYEAELDSVPSGIERQQLDFDMYYVVGPEADEKDRDEPNETFEVDSEAQGSAASGIGQKRPRASSNATKPARRSRKTAGPSDKKRSTPPAANPSKLSPHPRRGSRVAARRG